MLELYMIYPKFHHHNLWYSLQNKKTWTDAKVHAFSCRNLIIQLLLFYILLPQSDSDILFRSQRQAM